MERRELAPDERDHIKLARALAPLLASEGWRIYSGLIEGHIRVKEVELHSMDSSRERDLQNKGALIAMRLCLSLPSTIVSEADNILHSVGAVPSDDDLLDGI